MFKNWWKKTKETIIPHKHDFTLSYAVGDFRKYRCEDKECEIKKYTLETRKGWDFSDPENYKEVEATYKELTLEEAEPYIKKSEAGIRATMCLLDNVEPTASAGRDDGIDYPYKLDNGQIVEK